MALASRIRNSMSHSMLPLAGSLQKANTHGESTTFCDTLKKNIWRNKKRAWEDNALHDTDSMSCLALPI